MTTHYDTIGVDYANLRKPDPRIGAAVHAALGAARTVLNVGAGAGSYEPEDRDVTALEPSAEMIGQRPTGSAPVHQGVAEDLPFADNRFDAVMGVLTIHHWTDQAKGLAEMQRVSRGPVVLLTFDPAFRDFWLFDYLPELVTLDDKQMPPLDFYARHLGPVDIATVSVPHDCQDGFLGAYWRRPAAYLDPRIRKAISSFWVIDGVPEAMARLADDLQSGAWAEKYPDLAEREAYDLGYRLVTTRA